MTEPCKFRDYTSKEPCLVLVPTLPLTVPSASCDFYEEQLKQVLRKTVNALVGRQSRDVI